MHSVLVTKTGKRVVTFDPYNPSLPCKHCSDHNAPTRMVERTINYKEIRDYICDACYNKKTTKEKQDAKPFSKANMDLFWKTGGKRQLIKLFLIAAAMICLYAVIGYYERKTVDETWWWQPGTAAYERVNSWQGKPCDYNNDPNCEVG